MKIIFEKLNKEREALKKKEAYFKQHRAAFMPVIVAAERLEADFEVYDWSLRIIISGDAHKLAAMVRALRINGFKTHEDPPKKGQSSWDPTFTSDKHTGAIWLDFSSSVCRVVQTGTRMVEQPVFETVCDELILPEQREAVAS